MEGEEEDKLVLVLGGRGKSEDVSSASSQVSNLRNDFSSFSHIFGFLVNFFLVSDQNNNLLLQVV